MSGNICSRIGHIRARISELLTQTAALNNIPIDLNHEQYLEIKQKLTSLIEKIDQQIDYLKDWDKQYMQLIERVPAADKKEEDDKYQKFAYDDANAYLPVLASGEEARCELKGKLSVLDTRLASLNNSQFDDANSMLHRPSSTPVPPAALAANPF